MTASAIQVQTAQIIDAEIQQLLVDGYNTALELLRNDRGILEQLARMLLDKEVVDRHELRELMGTPRKAGGDSSRPEVGHAPATTGPGGAGRMAAPGAGRNGR